MSFPYFYGRAAEQYAFYRIPKLLFSDERFEALSTDAKLLYGMLIDRMELSMKNGWTDKDGRVFIYFTLEDARERLKCGTEKIVKLFAELDSEKGIGLIECVRQGFLASSRSRSFSISEASARYRRSMRLLIRW